MLATLLLKGSGLSDLCLLEVESTGSLWILGCPLEGTAVSSVQLCLLLLKGSSMGELRL